MLRRLPAVFVLAALAVAGAACAQPSEEMVRLRNLGYAQLENERPTDAESTYRELIELAPEEPLGHANLAVALLRGEQYEAALASIDRALDLGGDRADLLLVRAGVLQWTGERHEEALDAYRRAARAAPDDPETLYALFRHAEIMSGPEAEADRRYSVDRLRRLRPDNLLVLLVSGAAALEDGDRGRASDDYLRIRELIWQAQPERRTRARATARRPRGERPGAGTPLRSAAHERPEGDFGLAQQPGRGLDEYPGHPRRTPRGRAGQRGLRPREARPLPRHPHRQRGHRRPCARSRRLRRRRPARHCARGGGNRRGRFGEATGVAAGRRGLRNTG